MEKNLSEEVLDKIKQKRIKPKSKWQFILKDYVVWFVFVFSIILGSISFSTILHFWEMNDWEVYNRVNENFLIFAFLTVPSFWLVCFLLFLFTAYFYLKNTKAGYKYEFAKVVILNLALSLVFGSILYSFGAGRRVDEEFARRSNFYQSMRVGQSQIWFSPEKGMIAGRIVRIEKSGDVFELNDPHEMLWVVNARGARYSAGFKPREGFMVKVFGRKSDDNYFQAEEIRPLLKERGSQILFLPR